ncbi:MAG: hypothetical protein IPM68_15560 [Flavobacteriales bacterium]|nr:hypothetical protein [Flavobacteriales bacterium]
MEQLDHISTASNRNTRMSTSSWAIGAVVLLTLGACQKNEPLDQYGCTEMEYDNYDPNANSPDGSCCRFVDAGSRIWRGTVSDSASAIVVPYMVTRIAGWLEGPCMNMDRRAFSSVSDDICGEGVCHVQVGYDGPTLNRLVEAFGIENDSGCCLQAVALVPPVFALMVTFHVEYYADGVLVYEDAYGRYVGQDGRFGGYIAADQIDAPYPERGVDSVSVRITQLVTNP